MKTFTLLLLLASTTTYGQDRVSQRKTLSRNLDEIYQVQVTARKVKDGPYEVRDEKEHVLVKGQYKAGKKDGIWTYYGSNGEVVQQYDFASQKLLSSSMDTTTIVHSDFQVNGADDNDKVTPPVKIGGVNYGFYLLYDFRDIPADVKGVTTKDERMTYVFTISAEGQLVGWTVMYGGKEVNDEMQKKSIKGLPLDAYEFVPATLNGKPVASKLTYWVSLDINHTEIPGTNNIITQHPNN